MVNSSKSQKHYGVGDACDSCPGTNHDVLVDSVGCSLDQVDSDGDGFCDAAAPSLGPQPGCIRRIAVGGVAGLLETEDGDRHEASQR